MQSITLKSKIEEHKIFWFVSLILLCIVVRFIIGAVFSPYDEFDFRQELLTGEIAASGRNVYAEQKYYNYGPIFFIILGWFYKAAYCFSNSILAFKLMLTSILTLADLLTTILIAKKAGLKWALLFFGNPISLHVGAYTSQFDALTFTFAAYGINFLEESSKSKAITLNDVYGIILLSLSFITKHILWAFPLWILFSTRIDSRKKIIYAFIPPLLFLLSFIPYWNEGQQGIMNNVFLYRSGKNFPLIAFGFIKYTLGRLLPMLRKISFPAFPVYVILISLSGYVFRHEKVYNLFLLYTMAMVCFASGIYENYFTIPLMAIFIFSHSNSIPQGWLPKFLYFLFYFIRPRLIVESNLRDLDFLHVKCALMVWCLLYYLVYYYNNKLKRKFS